MVLRRSIFIAAAIALAVVLASSCGDSDSGSASPAGAGPGGTAAPAAPPASVRLVVDGAAWELRGTCTAVDGGAVQASYSGHDGTRALDLYPAGGSGGLDIVLFSETFMAQVSAEDWDGSMGTAPESLQVALAGGQLTITGTMYTGTFDNQRVTIDFTATCERGEAPETEGEGPDPAGEPVADLCALLTPDELAALPVSVSDRGTWQTEGTMVDTRGSTWCRWVLASDANPLLTDLTATVFAPGTYDVGFHREPRTGISADHPVEILDDPAGAVFAGNESGRTHYVWLVYGETYFELRQGLMVIPNEEMLATAQAMYERLP